MQNGGTDYRANNKHDTSKIVEAIIAFSIVREARLDTTNTKDTIKIR